MNPSVKQKIIGELIKFSMYASFLAVFFCSLITYRRLILEEYSISYFHYGYGIVEALLLSKIILLGEDLRLGEKLENRPLIILTLYRTIIYSFFVLIFSVVEHFVLGFLHGKNFMNIYYEFMDKGIDEVLAKGLVVFFVFILFFAFVNTSIALGENKLFNLFFYGKPKDGK